MGLFNSALQIGRSAIVSYQGALQVVGNNISNAASPDYTRLSPGLTSLQGQQTNSNLRPGAGVALDSIQRNIDEALEGRIRLAIGAEESAFTEQSALARVEAFFNQLGGTDISTRLTEFFQSFDDLQNTPENSATRDLAVTSAVQLAESLQSSRRELAQLGADFDGQIASLVESANDIAQKIGRLNGEITRLEAGSNGQSTALRDQRDSLLRELSRTFDVSTREEPDGGINVYIGSEALIQGSFVRSLATDTTADGSFVRTALRFEDTNGEVQINGGQVAGLLASRDEHAYGRIAAIDELAAALIADANALSADGQGLTGFRQLTGAVDLTATAVALNDPAVGLAQSPQSGSFYISVLDDATQTPVAHRIDVQLDGNATDTTLESLVADINSEVSGVTASITADQRLALVADDGLSFVFGFDGQQARTDTSNVLASLGVNTLFTGNSAANIQVNQTVREDSQLLASADTFTPGSGTIAGKLASLDVTTSRYLGEKSLMGAYNAISNDIAVASGAATETAEAVSTIMISLQAQRENISGVSLDEEAISLLKYERAFQGASRFVSVVDQLLGELVSLIR